jgi:hypothetical protein
MVKKEWKAPSRGSEMICPICRYKRRCRPWGCVDRTFYMMQVFSCIPCRETIRVLNGLIW